MLNDKFMSLPPPFVSSRVRVAGLLEVGLLLGLAGSWLGLLGGWHWMLDLGSHFRWQYVVACLLALAWAGWRKRRWLLAAALVSLGLNLWLMVRPEWQAPPGQPVPGFHVRVISFNVLTSNRNHAGVLQWLQAADADVIFLMEVDRGWAKALQPLLRTHPHHLILPKSDNFGLALFSRLPLAGLRKLGSDVLGAGPHSDSDLCMDSVEARLKLGGRELLILGTHPVPPMGREYAAARDRQLLALSQHTAQAGLPVLVVGDLNATPWSHGFRQLAVKAPLLPAPGAWKPTWRAGSLFAIPIDHALCTPPLLFQSRNIGPDLGSDHRPQVMELGWAG